MLVKGSSVKKLENHISDLILTLVTISQEPLTQQDFEMEFLLPECKKLQEMVSTKIPTTLADEAINQLISFILNTYKNLESSYCRDDRKKEIKRRAKRYLAVQDMYPTIKRKNTFCKKHVNFCQAIAIKIGCAIFHPSTTQLEFCHSNNMAKNPTFSGFLNLYLDRLLRMGKNLTKLVLGKQLSRKVVFDNLPRLQNLESFSFSDANDIILETLSVSCRNLKHLNVTDSKHVTDEGVEYISEMKNLQNLKIDGTSITENGLTYVLANLPYDQTNNGLECLRAVLSPTHINILARRYPNLTSLEVYLSEYCDISPLKKLTNLKNLNMCAGIDFEKSFIPLTPPSSPVSSTGNGCR